MRVPSRLAPGLVIGLVLSIPPWPSDADAAPVSFLIDPAASTFQLGGTFNGAPLVAQVAGSAITGYTGTLAVDLNVAAGSLSFGIAVPRALDQPQDQQPNHAPDPGASYGLKTGDGRNLLAVRAIDLFVRAGGAPYNAGGPTADQFGFFVNGGTLHYATPATPNGAADLHGHGGFGRVIGPITLSTAGDTETLTIPIQTQFAPDPTLPDAITLSLAGSVVATRAVPEPGILWVTGTASLFLVRRARRQPRS